MLPGDPRTPLHASSGCRWPTVPAWKYGFKCPNGTGIFEQLKFRYMKFAFRGAGPDPDLAYWDSYSAPLPFQAGIITKQVQPGTDVYTWSLELQLVFGGHLTIKTITGDWDGCNENVHIPYVEFPNPVLGNSGPDSSMIPFEFDDDEPPWPWPPM